MKKIMNEENNKGFSLVELIVVIAIMAVLIGVLAPQFLGYVDKTRQSADAQNAQELATEIAVLIADDEANGTSNVKVDGSEVKVEATLVQSVPDAKKVDGDWYYWIANKRTVNIGIKGGDGTMYQLYPTLNDKAQGMYKEIAKSNNIGTNATN